MRLIGIAGAARSGKDSIASVLVEDYGFTRYALADPIKAALRSMLGLTDDHTDGDLKEELIDELGVSPRHLMQTLGTEWGRDTIRPDLWLRAAERHLERINGPVVVPDIRMSNEAAWIRQKGGFVWHVRRPGYNPIGSEQRLQVEPGDHLTVNAGNLGHLESNVHAVMRHIVGAE